MFETTNQMFFFSCYECASMGSASKASSDLKQAAGSNRLISRIMYDNVLGCADVLG